MEENKGAVAAATTQETPTAQEPIAPQMEVTPTTEAEPVEKSEGEAEVPEPFHKNPAWKRIIEERDEFKAKYKELENRLSSEAQAKKATEGLTEEDLQALEKAYPELERRIFEKAYALEQEAQKVAAEEAARRTELEGQIKAEADRIIADVKKQFDDEGADFDDFTKYTQAIYKKYPNITDLNLVLDLYKEQGKFKPKDGVPPVSRPNAQVPNTPNKPKDQTYRKTDLFELAREGLKEKGLI